MNSKPICRYCKTELKNTFVDLGMSPLCESFLTEKELNSMEAFYPLKVYVCSNCFLVQLEEYVRPEEIFSEYAYFSSYSDSWLKHAKNYTEQMIERFHLDSKSLVIELASNDGYLLQYFVEKRIPVTGIEPAKNVAEVAIKKGIKTIVDFFGVRMANMLIKENVAADLLLGNNVLAQVPDINDFIKGMKSILKANGVITMEFPHLMRLMRGNQFDTIYHEHFSYFSLISVERIFAEHGITLFDVEELDTHGGSLRIYGKHSEEKERKITDRYKKLKKAELEAGFNEMKTYTAFSEQVIKTKQKLLQILIKIKQERKIIAGYGAPGKGNTLLNYCGIRTDFLDYTVDRNPYKHGRYTPGTHIKIFPPEKIEKEKPDYIFILPWNLKTEIMEQLSYIRNWGGKFIVPIPNPTVYE